MDSLGLRLVNEKGFHKLTVVEKYMAQSLRIGL